MDIVDDRLRQPQQVESQAREQEARRVYQELETACWAPWLQYAEEDLVGQVAVFSEGQLVVQDEAGLAASLSTNRINWNGEVDQLPTWDGIAGDEEDFADTYVADGNTIALMSMNVAPHNRGERLPQKMIKQIQELAQKEGVDHLVGDFRPNNFGAYKKATGNFDFAAYCQRTREDGSFDDGWLRAVSRIGGKFLRPDLKSMVVEASLDEFGAYQTGYTPEKWWQVTDPEAINSLKQQHLPDEQLAQIDEVWECEETGTWYVDKQNQKAVYIESNLWGELPLEPEASTEKHPARYDLSPEELVNGQAELVKEIEAKLGKAEDLYTVWLNPRSPYSNVVRTFEAEKFPEVPNLVTDEVEDASQFLAIVDTRLGANRIIHATRISGVQAEKAPVVDAEGAEVLQKTGIIMVDEIIDSGQDFTAKDFYKYYPAHGVDLAHCMGVETNFVIGEYPEKYNGLSSAQVGYLALFKLLEDKGMTAADGGVFANINIDSINSFAKLGLEYSAFVGRTDLRTPTVNEQGELDFDPKYQPVFVPADEHNSAIFAELHQIAGAPQLYL